MSREFTMKCWLAFLALLAPTQSIAAASSAEEAVLAYFTGMRAEGLAAIADHAHPDESARFKAYMDDLFDPAVNSMAGRLRIGIFGTQVTDGMIREMPPAVFMRGVLGLLDRARESTSADFDSQRIIGSQQEGDTVHVVVRITAQAGAGTTSSVRIISARQYSDGWGLLLPPEIVAGAESLKRNGMKPLTNP